MSSHNKYDAILASIAVMIILMLAGLITSSPVAIIPGIAGATLVAFALFVVPPTGETIYHE